MGLALERGWYCTQFEMFEAEWTWMRRPDYAVWGFDFRVLVLSLVALVIQYICMLIHKTANFSNCYCTASDCILGRSREYMDEPNRIGVSTCFNMFQRYILGIFRPYHAIPLCTCGILWLSGWGRSVAPLEPKTPRTWPDAQGVWSGRVTSRTTEMSTAKTSGLCGVWSTSLRSSRRSILAEHQSHSTSFNLIQSHTISYTVSMNNHGNMKVSRYSNPGFLKICLPAKYAITWEAHGARAFSLNAADAWGKFSPKSASD